MWRYVSHPHTNIARRDTHVVASVDSYFDDYSYPQRLSNFGTFVCPRILKQSSVSSFAWPRLMTQSTLTSVSWPKSTNQYLKNINLTRNFSILDNIKNKYDERNERKQREMFDKQVELRCNNLLLAQMCTSFILRHLELKLIESSVFS